MKHLLNIFNWWLEENYTDIVGCNDQHMSNSPYADNQKFIRKYILSNLNMLFIYLNKLIIAHLNIKSIKNKFGFLVNKIKGNIDIVLPQD